MRGRTIRATIAVAIAAVLVAAPARAQQADLGHRIPGTLGLRAGSVPDQGLHADYEFIGYLANSVVDRNGNSLAQGLGLHIIANEVGLGLTLRIKRLRTFYSLGASVPFARVRAHSTPPQLDVDRYGLGDVYVKPVQLGWRIPHVDLIASYGFYVPTGRFEPGPRGGVSSAQWTHEYSLGGTAYFDKDKTWHLSALASYVEFGRKKGIDVTRGDMVEVQGGAGRTLFRVLDLGVASYGLWQVSDDSGSDLPPALRGARDQAFGLGPEAAVDIRKIRTRIVVRYEHDLRVRARPFAQLLFASASVKAW
jgi:hypothetical protein